MNSPLLLWGIIIISICVGKMTIPVIGFLVFGFLIVIFSEEINPQ